MSDQDRYCPLCQNAHVEDYFEDRKRAYLKCKTCSLVFVPPEFYISIAEERSRYELHDNDPADEGYTGFLKRIVDPLVKEHPDFGDCLDFGCGPAPVLAEMLAEEGFTVTAFDPIFRPDAAFAASYDVITATEVFEHLRNPAFEIENLVSRLSPGGTLAVMTRILEESIDFADWHYKNDKTHICFYAWESFERIAERFGLNAERIDRDIVFLRKETDA